MKRLLLVLLAGLCSGRSLAAGLDERQQKTIGVDRPAHPAFQHSTLPEWETSASGPLRPLPDGFRILEYVESTGEQYVDTGVHVGPGSRSETDVAVLDWDASTYALSGTTRTDSRHSFGKGYSGRSTGSGNATKLYFGLGAQNYTANVSLSSLAGVRHVYWVDAPSFKAGFDERSFSLTATGDIGVNPTTSLLLAQSVGSNVRGWMAARLYGCRYYENGVLVRDFRPAKDAAGVAGLFDLVTGRMFYSATATPLVAGPEIVDLSSVDPLLPSSRNWYRAWLAATNPPAATPGAVAVDALVLPVGITSPIRDQTNALVEVLVAEPPMLKALVQRYRSGLAPTNVPVNLAHSPTSVVGAVADLWWVEGEGVWARLLVPESVASAGLRPSCEILGLRAHATDAWGTWGDFWLPWQIRGVALVERPALATPVVYPSAVPASPYPGVVRP